VAFLLRCMFWCLSSLQHAPLQDHPAFPVEEPAAATEVPKVIGRMLSPQPNVVTPEPVGNLSRHLYRLFAFFDSLLLLAALVVEVDDLPDSPSLKCWSR